MPKFLHNVFKKKFWALINIIFFIYFLFFIEKKIKSLGIRKIKVFKYSNWDDGFMHFKGIVDHKPKRKVFIKIDLILKNIRNEYLALKNISKIKNKPFKTPKIYHSTNSYIITEFIPQCLPVKFNDIEVKNRRKLISFLVKKK